MTSKPLTLLMDLCYGDKFIVYNMLYEVITPPSSYDSLDCCLADNLLKEIYVSLPKYIWVQPV